MSVSPINRLAGCLLVAGGLWLLGLPAHAEDELDRLVEDVIELSGAEKVFAGTLEELLPQLRQQVRQIVAQSKPDVTEAQLAKVDQAVVSEFRAIMNEHHAAMMPELKRFYRDQFTAEELRRLATLIREPVVQKQMTLVPRFMAEMNPRMQSLMIETQQRISSVVARELR